MNKLFNPPQLGVDGKQQAGLVLSGLVLVFIDDIPIFSKTAEDHERHLQIVFDLLRKEQLQIKPQNVFGVRLNCHILASLWRRMASSLIPERLRL